MSKELSNFGDSASASLTRGAGHNETVGIEGFYHVECRDAQGNLKWEDTIENVVTAVGKQALFDYYFGATGTAGGTASGANYLGLVGYTGTLVTAGSFVVGSTYQIASLGTTTNAQWQTIAGTSSGTYVVGSVFVCANAGTGTGTANLIGTFAAADTMASHAGWVEVGLANAPTYTGSRQSINWTAATSTGTSPSNITSKTGGAITFAMTSSGSVGGCFINGGASASATKDTTTGVLYSAGAFTGGYKTVANGDSLAVTYTTTATS
jgi:hypothetical protein